MSEIKHFDKTHFTAITIEGKKFTYCPIGNICSWHPQDYNHKFCAYCQKFFEEMK